MLDHELPGVGAIIYYKVRPSDLPINADREWKGKVIKVHPKTSFAIASLEVESLEDGYKGEIELVMPSQIQVVIRESIQEPTAHSKERVSAP
jgi:hypothetical protein